MKKEEKGINWGKAIFILIVSLVLLGLANTQYQKAEMERKMEQLGW